MNQLQYNKLCNRLRDRGLLFEWQRLNAVRHHNENETLKHFMCKCICSKVLFDAGHSHFVEYEFKNGKVADVFDADEMVCVEFETGLTAKKEAVKQENFKEYISGGKIRDVFVIDVDSLPDDNKLIYDKIKFILGV